MQPWVGPIGIFNSASGYAITSAFLPDNSTGYWSSSNSLDATHSGSIWVQRNSLGSVEPILDDQIYFNASNQLVINGLITTAVYRDTTAPYHIQWNSSAAYVNGVEVSGTGTYATASISNTRIGFDGTNYSDLYFSGGQDLALYSGSDVLTGGKFVGGRWEPSRPSPAPTYTLTDFTEQGTVTAVTNTPTDVGAAFNELDKGNTVTLKNGNTTLTTGAATNLCPLTLAVPDGVKIHFEFDHAAFGDIALFALNGDYAGDTKTLSVGSTVATGMWEAYDTGGNIYETKDGGAFSGIVAPSKFAAAGVTTLTIDGSTGDVWLGQDGTFYDSSYGTTGNPATGANPTWTLGAKPPFLACVTRNSAGSDINLVDADSQTHTPSGFVSSKFVNLVPDAFTSGTVTTAGSFQYTGGVSSSISGVTVDEIYALGFTSTDTGAWTCTVANPVGGDIMPRGQGN